ncbi:vacuolar protein sorting/targeting protein PEP1 [Podila verticillata]|nr:vacuolar protein sorting/targeting protein PEP1 [Podila verticillata]
MGRQVRERSRIAQISSAILLVAMAIPTLVQAGPGRPSITTTEFRSSPRKLSYFQDSAVVLLRDYDRNVHRSADEGKHWELVKGVPEGRATDMMLHTFDPKQAYILTGGKTQYKTTDYGATWTSFETENIPIGESHVLSFHATREDWVLIAVTNCEGHECHDETYYTKDGFASAPKRLLSNTHKCEWAYSSSLFDEAPVELIHCLEYKTRDGGMRSLDDVQLVKSQDFFVTKERVILGGLDRSAIVNFVTKERFMLAAEKHITTGDMNLWVSEDARVWAKANFPLGSNLRQDVSALLVVLVVDVKANADDAYGSLMLSNSNGTYFVRAKQYTNRNRREDLVDFEKIQNVDGVYIVNIVDNHDQNPLEEREKKLRTQISFEAGSTWQYLMPPATGVDGRRFSCTPNTEGTCSLHLHSVTSAKVSPPVFSSKAAPGVVMGIGNVGPYLLPREDCDTYLSEDGGLTWKAVLEHPHKYEFGDMGGIVVAVRDDGNPVSYLQYTADRGQTWNKMDLEENMRPEALFSDPESTSQKFLLFARNRDVSYAYHLDLTNIYDRKCERNDNNEGRSDFEKWYARKLGNNPDCLMGAKTWYWRRKANAECMVQETFKDPSATDEICPCTDEDFECDYINNYVLRDGNCILEGKERMPNTCKKEGDTYLGSSGYSLVPGNKCDREKGLKKDEGKERKCTAESIPSDITHSVTKFESPMGTGFQYFLRSDVVMFLTGSSQAWRSDDDGSTWKRVLPDAGKFIGLSLHDENEKLAYLFTNDALYVTHNRGESWDRRDLPAPPNTFGYPLVDFHPDGDKNDWMLYLGQISGQCWTTLYRTKDAGRNWAQVDTWVDKAVYASHREYDMPDHGIFSMAWKKPLPWGSCQNDLESTDANPLQMVYMLDSDSNRLVHFDYVTQFYVVKKFLIVAVEKSNNFILQVSLDGKNFHQAEFPPNIRVDQNSFTVVQSTTGSIVVDVAKSGVEGREHGIIFKSNSNGTYFSIQLENSNRNKFSFVDWEKIGGIEGVILANKVVNTKSLSQDGEKHIQTVVSFNDGSSWETIRAPAGSDCDDCHLHLHSVTDYNGPGAVFSASSAVGLVMGVGNVGKYLLPLDQCQTYLSRDAGRTWRKVNDRASVYEFGDEGGVLVLADNAAPTQEAMFSYDFGTTWQKTIFADSPVLIQTVTTEPTSSISKITITGVQTGGDTQFVISTLDFSARRNCVFDKGNKDKNDFEKWSPFEDSDDRCILGQDISYWRRKPDRPCRVNDKDGSPEMEQSVCKCTARDFECDIGFFRDETGGCQRFGYDPEKPKKCDGTYKASAGFRKIDASKCTGGEDLSKKTTERQCGVAIGVQSKVTTFDSRYREGSVFYFPDSDVVMLWFESGVHISRNEGKDWDRVEVEGSIISLERHPYERSTAVITTAGHKQYITQDKGDNWDALDLPVVPALSFRNYDFWSFHPSESGWFIFMGEKDCGYEGNNRCHAEAYVTRDAGKHWAGLADWVKSCSWAQDNKFKRVNFQGIYCEQYADKSVSQKQLSQSTTRFVYSGDFMASVNTLYEEIVGYAIYSEYLVLAEFVPGQSELRIAVSQDGLTFVKARYPQNFDVVNPAYTVLDSTTRSVFLGITTNDVKGYKFGNLFRSDSNGSYFSLSRKFLNQGDEGTVDFEKMKGINGVALMNEVMNPNDVLQRSPKQLRSLATFDNGYTWETLNAPQTDVDGKNFPGCLSSEKCTLHLHNYLHRKHSEDMFSTSSIPGMAIGVGNVGEKLGEYKEGGTFLTRDGGHSWKEILHGAHQYDFGDHGSIILLIKDDEVPTDHVIYSMDHGQSFQQYEFSKDKFVIRDIVAKPNGIGKSFLLFAVPPAGSPNQARHVIIQIDFEGLVMRPCRLDLNDEDNDDFERWSLAGLRGEECMFGRKVEYFRRIEDRQCFVGEIGVNPREIVKNCQCEARDFECDFNYAPDDKGNCVLIDNATPAPVNEKEMCANLPDGQNFYYLSTGYRKMAFSSCVGEHERFGTKVMCPGKGGGMGFFSWIAILGASGGLAYGLAVCMNRNRSLFGGRQSFIRLGNDMYDQLPSRSSSLPTMNMPRSFSSLSRVRVPDFVYQVWDKIASLPVMPTRVTNYFNRVRYQNLSQEPSEVIMDDYFDHYLDDDDDGANAADGDPLVGRRGDSDAQERYRDDSDDDASEDLDGMV